MANREFDVRAIIKLVLALLLTILVVIFVLANIQDTRVNFLLFTMEGPLALVLFLTFAAGVATGILGSLAALRHKRPSTAKKPSADKSTTPPAPAASPGRAKRSRRGQSE